LRYNNVMKIEHLFVAVVGMFLLAYVLDAVVDPLNVPISQPFEYLSQSYMSRYPFSTASVLIRALALFLTPVLLVTFLRNAHAAKGGLLLITAILMMLYSIQQIATGAGTVPLEWALSLAYAGAALLLPSVYFMFVGIAVSTHRKVKRGTKDFAPYTGSPDDAPEWLEEE
jgi:hypothetical protein